MLNDKELVSILDDANILEQSTRAELLEEGLTKDSLDEPIKYKVFLVTITTKFKDLTIRYEEKVTIFPVSWERKYDDKFFINDESATKEQKKLLMEYDYLYDFNYMELCLNFCS